MSDVSEFITHGLGTPSTIPYFLTFGLGNFAATTPLTAGGTPSRFSETSITRYDNGIMRLDDDGVTLYDKGIRQFGSGQTIRRFDT